MENSSTTTGSTYALEMSATERRVACTGPSADALSEREARKWQRLNTTPSTLCRALGLPRNATLCGLNTGRVLENVGIGPLQCEAVTPGYDGSDHDDTTSQKMIRRECPLAPFLRTAFKFIAATWQPPGSGDRQVSDGDQRTAALLYARAHGCGEDP
jgi:hypothetical protein